MNYLTDFKQGFISDPQLESVKRKRRGSIESHQRMLKQYSETEWVLLNFDGAVQQAIKKYLGEFPKHYYIAGKQINYILYNIKSGILKFTQEEFHTLVIDICIAIQEVAFDTEVLEGVGKVESIKFPTIGAHDWEDSYAIIKLPLDFQLKLDADTSQNCTIEYETKTTQEKVIKSIICK